MATSQVPGTTFRYRVPVFHKLRDVPRPLFGKDKKVVTEVRRNANASTRPPQASRSHAIVCSSLCWVRRTCTSAWTPSC